MASAPHRGLETRATTRSDRAFGRARGRARGVASERGGVSRWVALGFATHISAATSYAFSPGSETSPPSDEPAFAPSLRPVGSDPARRRVVAAEAERRKSGGVLFGSPRCFANADRGPCARPRRAPCERARQDRAREGNPRAFRADATPARVKTADLYCIYPTGLVLTGYLVVLKGR